MMTWFRNMTSPRHPEDGAGSGGGSADSGVCKWCGEVHEGFWGGIVGFFHDVFYFFAHLFD